MVRLCFPPLRFKRVFSILLSMVYMRIIISKDIYFVQCIKFLEY